jgi:hypothetical protein
MLCFVVNARKLPYGTPPQVIAATITPNARDAVDLD